MPLPFNSFSSSLVAWIVCCALTFCCDAKDKLSYRDVLYDVVTSKELLGFKIERVKEHPDMLRAFPNLPILIKISKRKLENNKYLY